MEIAQIAYLVAAVVFALGLICAGFAIWETRTTQGAIAWTIALVGIPYIAVPLYFVFGRRKFRGYVLARREAELETRQTSGATSALLPDKSELSPHSLGAIRVVETLADLPFTQGNSSRLLIDGAATFEAIFAAIDAAKSYLLVQFYIIRDDGLGHRLSERLVAASERGVRVYLLYDEVGSGATKRAYFDEMRRAGVMVSKFYSAKGFGNKFQLNFRNHRKIVVADGRVAYIGGSNVGDEYLGQSRKFGKWRDTHVELRGPVVKAAQLAFVEDWSWATGETPHLDWSLPVPEPANQTALVLSTGPADLYESCSLFFVQAINAAMERIWIVSPYFVPDLDVIAALRLAGLRGVDVRIMVPDEIDHLIVWLAAFHYFEEMAADNVRFYRFTDGFLHQKVMLVDDRFATVGTANMDNRSFRLNFEVTVLVADERFASEVEEMLKNDIARSRLYDHGEYRNRPWWFKLAVRFARLASPVL